MPDLDDRRSLTQERLKEIRASVGRIVEPLRQELAEIDAAIQEVDEIKAEMVEIRREVAAVVRAADRDGEYASKKKPSQNGSGRASSRISEERVQTVEDWLRANADDYPDGYTVPELHAAGIGVEKSALNVALHKLHDRGVIRLDGVRRGGHGTPPKVYKLTS